MFSPIWGKENGRGISGFAVNRGAVNRGFTVYNKGICWVTKKIKLQGISKILQECTIWITFV